MPNIISYLPNGSPWVAKIKQTFSNSNQFSLIAAQLELFTFLNLLISLFTRSIGVFTVLFYWIWLRLLVNASSRHAFILTSLKMKLSQLRNHPKMPQFMRTH